MVLKRRSITGQTHSSASHHVGTQSPASTQSGPPDPPRHSLPAQRDPTTNHPASASGDYRSSLGERAEFQHPHQFLCCHRKTSSRPPPPSTDYASRPADFDSTNHRPRYHHHLARCAALRNQACGAKSTFRGEDQEGRLTPVSHCSPSL